MMKNLKTGILLFILLAFGFNYCSAQPGYDCTYDREEILRLTFEINEHPDSTELHEQRLLLNNECGSFKHGLEDINYLLSKSPDSKKYLLDKVYLYLRHSYLDSTFENSIPVFDKYFELEIDPCTIRPLLMRIGRAFDSKNNSGKAIEYYNKALNTKCERGYYDDEKIIHEKKEVYHNLNQHKEAYEMLKQIDELSLEAIRYNTIYIKDYKTSRKNIYARLDKLYEKNKTETGFTFHDVDYSLERDILELAYTEYKLGNEEVALNILYDFIFFDYKNLFISMGEVYSPYWCMYLDLYKKHYNDHRIHLITSYNFTKQAHSLVSFRHDKESLCKPKSLLDLDFLSWNDMEKKINEEALKEIEIAENLTPKKFDLYRAITLREMENDNESIKILKKLIAQSPNDISVNRAISLSYLSRSKSDHSLDHKKYIKYREKVKILTESDKGFILKK